MMNKLLLHHRAVLERDEQTEYDRWGQLDAPDWEPGPCLVPCRAWVDRASRIDAGTKVVVASNSLRLICALDADITLRDRVTRIEDSAGSVLFDDGPYAIESIDRHGDHRELNLSDKGVVRV